MTQSHTTRRTAEQWQILLNQWEDSGLSTQDFYNNQGIGCASFCN